MLADLFAQQDEINIPQFAENRQAVLFGMFQFIETDKSFYNFLLSEGLREGLEDAYRYQPLALEEPDRQFYYRNRLVAAGITRLICDWLVLPNPQTPKEMAEQLDRLFG